MNETPACPCEVFVHPKAISNPPGLEVIRYRSGDFATFREALLRPRAGETALASWRPGREGDLAVQLIEWWAYLADILTFYDERLARQTYLRTADLPESTRRLVRILGYRPQPGMGSKGSVAAVLQGRKSIAVPRGFPLQSKPGPGKDPQFFEVDSESEVVPPDATAIDLPPVGTIGDGVLLQGAATSVKPGDDLLLLKKEWMGEQQLYALVKVKNVSSEKDPRGKKNTRVGFVAKPGLPAGSEVEAFRLLRSEQSMGLWPDKNVEAVLFSDPSASTGTSESAPGPLPGPGPGPLSDKQVALKPPQANLSSVARSIKTGEPVLFEVGGLSAFRKLVRVTGYTELIWFLNPPDPSDPTKGPNPQEQVPVPILHSQFEFSPKVNGTYLNDNREMASVRFDWREVGRMIASPVATADAKSPLRLSVAGAGELPAGVVGHQVLVEDGRGSGASARVVAVSGTPPVLDLGELSGDSGQLAGPFQLYFNLLPVSRGKTVASEVLGSGDATAAGQEFKLQKSPLTYFPSGESTSGEGYASTLRVFVGGVEWREVPTFYGLPADAQVFVTREDEEGKTHVQFGDGVRGSRLPSGSDNVTATYRYGSGAEAPAPGQLTVLTNPFPGLKAVRNPVPPSGGSDPDSPQRLRALAPRSVLTFGRAVSADDYEVIAAKAPGVDRARAYFTFDRDSQRTGVTIYVGDTPGARSAAREAIAGAADPNRPFIVQSATAVPIAITLTVLKDPRFLEKPIRDGVNASLTDSEGGLLGARVVRIGQAIYRSQVYETCLRVRGVLAVHQLEVKIAGAIAPGQRYFPGEGKFLQLDAQGLSLSVEDLPDGD